MKHVFGMALVALLASAAGAAQPVARTTAKAVEPFARCFASAQDRASMPWWFVPRAGGGGTFSNAGAEGVPEPYFMDIADKGATREIRLTSANDAVLRAADRCI